MKRKKVRLALFLALCLALAACSAHTETWSATDAAAAALEALIAGDYAAVEAQLDESVKSMISVEAIQQAWEDAVDTFGPYVETAEVNEAEQSGYAVVSILVTHERGQQTTSFAFNASGKIAGLQLQPVTQYIEEEPLPLPSGAVEEPVALRAGEPDETAGLLTLPAGDGPFPAVVLIHGSGASDRDEAVFGVKPFRDLAMGLAERGVATLRYDKYTFAHADLFQSIPSIKQEYERDVLAAVKLLASDSRVSDIYLLGHSEGGMLIPRLLAACESGAKGGVIFAGSPRPLWEIQRMQNEDVIAKLSEDQRAPSQAVVDAETEKGNRLLEMTDEQLATETVFGIPALYHKDLVSVDPIATAKDLSLPLLILQGGKDFQVSPEADYGAWQAGLDGSAFATFKLYPDLTHMFISLEGESTRSVEDYTYGGHVSAEVIDDIAAWVKER